MPGIGKLMKRFSNLTAILCVLFAAGIAAAQEPVHGEVDSVYDEKKNTTTVGIRRLEVIKTDAQLVLVNVDFVFPGKKQTTRPEFLFFIVQILSKGDYRYPDVMNTQLIVDGKPIANLTLGNLDKRKIESSSLESIGMRLSPDIFERLARGTSAEFTLDKTRIVFNSSQLAKFAELAKRLDP